MLFLLFSMLFFFVLLFSLKVPELGGDSSEDCGSAGHWEVAPVQVERGVEHVHTLELSHGLQEVAVWMSSKYLRNTHLLAAQGLIVKSRLCWCSGHLSDQD